jgi:hypothetical protein
MKALITLSIIALVVVTGKLSFMFFLKDNYLISGLFTAACLLCVSLSISSVKPLENEENKS